MKPITRRCAFFFLLPLAITGLPALRAIAETPSMQRTADEFTKMLSQPGSQPAGLKPRGATHTRGFGKIVPDQPPPLAPLPTVDELYSVANQSYPELTKNQRKARAPIQFEYNSARIREESHGVLDELVQALQSTLADAVLIVAGHTDSKGSAGYNRPLSESRAQAVKDYLISRGVSSERLIVRGYGEDYPIEPNDTEDGRAVNRRSEFIRVGSLKRAGG